jgi:MFS transporter, ACS family, hexuronate transporter
MLNSVFNSVKPYRTIPHLRWVIAVLLLLASVMNYVDRQTLSILARTIQTDLGINDAGYAQVVLAFQLTYAVMYLLSGRILDAIGTRLGLFCFIVWWSGANMLTGLASGVLSLAFFRSLLGMGEPGGYTASAKAVAEWFPVREKGMAVGLYTMGGTLGAAIAGPLVAFITVRHGWQMAFFVTGSLGLLLGLAWLWLYRKPAEHPYRSGKKIPASGKGADRKSSSGLSVELAGIEQTKTNVDCVGGANDYRSALVFLFVLVSQIFAGRARLYFA